MHDLIATLSGLFRLSGFVTPGGLVVSAHSRQAPPRRDFRFLVGMAHAALADQRRILLADTPPANQAQVNQTTANLTPAEQAPTDQAQSDQARSDQAPIKHAPANDANAFPQAPVAYPSVAATAPRSPSPAEPGPDLPTPANDPRYGALNASALTVRYQFYGWVDACRTWLPPA